MKVTRGIENIVRIDNTVSTLGSYDGVHAGHQAILSRVKAIQTEYRLPRSLVVTFHPHPQEVLRKMDSSVKLLTTIEERLELLAASGIDETLIINFSLEFSKTPYKDFFSNVIVNAIGTTKMVVGYNHAFGKDREGDIDHLRSLALGEGMTVEEMAPFLVNGQNVSSTKIRHALLQGDIDTASIYLGRRYSIGGIVVKGDGIGRKFGFPTANIQIKPDRLLPADGVYAAKARAEGKSYIAAVSIGTRPTIVHSDNRVFEAFLLDYDGELYGKHVDVDFVKFLRAQIEFSSIDELTSAIALDVKNVHAVFSGLML